jgi:hypothetical protein
MAGEDLTSIHGSASRPGRAPVHGRPPGTTDATVAALGKLSEALETVEHARGLLYGFHRLSGSADLALQEAVEQLRAAGHDELAADIATVLIGRDVVDGRGPSNWSRPTTAIIGRSFATWNATRGP